MSRPLVKTARLEVKVDPAIKNMLVTISKSKNVSLTKMIEDLIITESCKEGVYDGK